MQKLRNEAMEQKAEVRDPTIWTILRQDGPNHLGLKYDERLEHQMGLITSDCAPFRRSG